jgi:D-alanyl-D-alanine carboxypeptidase (penicillin-binding protein 5/6)
MRHFLIALTLISLTLLPLHAMAETTIDIPAREVLLLDASTDTILLDKNADQPMPPASMSKLMTAYVVFDSLKQGKIKLSDTFKVSQKAWAMQGSKMFVDIDTMVSVEDLLRGMIIQSGNDACIVLAEGISGSEESFAQLMNSYAKQIGLKGSYFINSTGWPHPEHRMTARDLTHLAMRLMHDFPEYTHYYKELDFTYHGIKQGNRNPLLYGFPGAEGLKTGHTDEAGYGLVMSASRDGRRLVGMIGGLSSMQARADESRRLLEWGYREFRLQNVAKAGAAVTDAQVWGGKAEQVPLVLKQDIKLTLPNSARSAVTAQVKYTSPLRAPITPDSVAGELVIKTSTGQQYNYPLYPAAAVEARGFFSRAWRGLSYLLTGQ